MLVKVVAGWFLSGIVAITAELKIKQAALIHLCQYPTSPGITRKV
jgi:hypothetical protein